MRYGDAVQKKHIASAAIAVQWAIAAAGGQTALAKAVGVKPQSVQGWLKSGSIPAERIIRVEQATGISRAALRPDLFAGMGGDDSTG